jgi:IS5 family transposase
MLFKRPTRRDRVLVDIEATTSWGEWVAVIGRRYPKGGRDRPPIGPERMRRMDIAQNGFGLSDEGREDVVDDGRAIQGFVGIDPGHVTAPDATTRFECRRLLEDKRLTESLFTTVNARPAAKVFPRRGTAVEATIIEASPSTWSASPKCRTCRRVTRRTSSPMRAKHRDTRGEQRRPDQPA